MSALIYRAAGFSPGDAAEKELKSYQFSPQVFKLPLGALLWLIRSIGLISDGNGLRRRQRSFPRTDLNLAIQVGQATIGLLKDWPLSFRQALNRMVPEDVSDATALNFNGVFGNFYRHLFRILPRRDFGFLHDAFEQFVVEDWNTPIRQRRYFAAAVRRTLKWMSADEAEKTAHVTSSRIVDLVRRGQIRGTFLDGRGRTECWINRESLDRWVKSRNGKLAQYMRRPEAMLSLGLHHRSVMSIARAGLIRYLQGTEYYFPAGFYFLREDVLKIRDVFRKHAVSTLRYSKPGKVIALRHALKNYLGRDFGLPSVIRALLDGSIRPIGYTERFPGITGYIFRSEDLQRYRPVQGARVPREGAVNYREASGILGVAVPVIRGLVAEGIFHALAQPRNGFSKLVATADVKRFSERYVAISVIARRFKLNSGSLARYLKESGTPLLSIRLPEAGKGHAYFLTKEIAGQTRIPTRRMLREKAECRIKAARKQRWALFRQAKETALGKPIRRAR